MTTQHTTIEFWCQLGGRHPVVGDIWHRFAIAHGNESERYSRYLCAALLMMVHVPSDCDAMIKLLDSVADGDSQLEAYGLNDTSVTFRPNGVQVEILIEDEPTPAAGRFNLGEYRRTLCAFKAFLLMPGAKETRLLLQLS